MGTIGALPNTYRSSRSSVGMPWVTLRVTNLRHAAYSKADAERPELHTHAEHGHDRCSPERLSFLTLQRGNALGDAPRHRSAPRRILKADAERPERHTDAERRQDSQSVARAAPTAVNSRRRRSWAGSALVWRIRKGSIPVHGPNCVARQSADAGRCCFRYYPTAPARFRR